MHQEKWLALARSIACGIAAEEYDLEIAAIKRFDHSVHKQFDHSVHKQAWRALSRAVSRSLQRPEQPTQKLKKPPSVK
jgi:hypothetical protein